MTEFCCAGNELSNSIKLWIDRKFYIFLTAHLLIILVSDQLDAQFLL